MSPTFSSLAVRNYRIYAIGAFVSNVGTWMQNTAQAWLILQLTDSGSALGVTVALQMLPSLLLSPLGGVLADRLPKRTVMQIMQVAMAVPSALLGVLAVLDVVQTWHVYVLAFLFGVGRALEAPARQSFVSEVVEADNLSNAVSLNSASFNAGRLIGPGIAGLLIALMGSGVVGTGWVIVINAATYAASYVALQVMDASRLCPSVPVTTRKGAMREGLRYVRDRPDLVLALTCVFLIGGFGMNFQITSALMATEEFGRGAGEYGVLGSLLAIGSLTGALLAARRARPGLRFIVLASMAFSVVQVVSGVMPSFATYAVTLPFIGLCLMSMGTTSNALVQLTSAPEMRGRVAALYVMVFIGSVPFTSPLIGWLAQIYGPRSSVIVSGVVAGVGVLVALAWYVRKTGDQTLGWRQISRAPARSAARPVPPPVDRSSGRPAR